jgi:hypothetical protein
MAVTAYDIGTYAFRPREFFPLELFARITEIRISRPSRWTTA